MKVALRDAHSVVRRAKRGGRSVVLGGHSLGASLTLAYAAWDFGGKPGYKDLDGMVLIDGGLLGSFNAFDLDQAKQAIAELATASPFVELLGPGLSPRPPACSPRSAGCYAQPGAPTAGDHASELPAAAGGAQSAVPVTDRALLGYAFDRDTSPLGPRSAGQCRRPGDRGRPARLGRRRRHPGARLADTFGQEPSNSDRVVLPKRLTIDTNGADQLRHNAVARYLGLRLFHSRQVDFRSTRSRPTLTGGGVLRGARRLIERARTTRAESTAGQRRSAARATSTR